MEDNELKCKLEQMVSGMGYEVKEKFRKEMDPIHKLFILMIVFGFLTVGVIMASFVTTVYLDKHQDYKKQEKNIIYIDRIIEKEKIVKVHSCNIEDKKKGFEYIKTVERKNRIYEYYRKKDGDIWEFYTVAYKKGDYNGCKFQRK